MKKFIVALMCVCMVMMSMIVSEISVRAEEAAPSNIEASEDISDDQNEDNSEANENISFLIAVVAVSAATIISGRVKKNNRSNMSRTLNKKNMRHK